MIYSAIIAVVLVCLLGCMQSVAGQTWPSGVQNVNGGDQGHDGSSLVEFNGKLWVAFAGSDNGIWLFSSSNSGSSWSSGNLLLSGHQFNGEISLVAYNNNLFAFAAGSSYGLCVIGSPDGNSWPSDCAYPIGNGFKSPSAAVFGNTLYVSVSGSQWGYCVVSTSDVINWSGCNYVPTNVVTKLFATSSTLYLTYNQNNQFYIASTTTPSAWVNAQVNAQPFLQPVGGQNAPALALLNNKLYLAFQGLNNGVWFTASSDGGNTWIFPEQILGSSLAGTSPSLIAYNGKLAIAFSGTDQKAYFALSN